ncbi:tetratricopeptide repeat-containing sensor histidine kinase [Larkinella soli]|uniref:tetratricopeptide repeat-containing sensor histidine kinase n=1 Tax=Larkinella soli TaxID=1770527 RepID=UPI000FFBBE33|nr:sensor histidine kinase [Larkinella soli]
MKRFLLLWAIQLLLQDSFAQSAETTDYTRFKTEIAAQPDTVRIARMGDFAQRLIEKGRAGEALTVLNEALAIAEGLQDDRQLSRVQMYFGRMELDQGAYPAALERFQTAVDLLKNTPDHRQKIVLHLRIGQTYFLSNDLTQAERYFLEALKLARTHKKELLTADTYSELANLEDSRKNPHKALIYNAKAIAIYKAHGEDYISTLFNRAIEYKNAGNYVESERIYRQVLKYADEHNDDFIRGYVHVNLPNTLLLLDRPDEAERYARLALKWSENGPDRLKIREDLFDVLTRIYEKRGRFAQALAYARQKAVYRDSVLNADKARQLVMAESRFQARQQQARIQDLDEANLRKNRQLLWVSAGLIVVVGLLGLLFRQNRLIRRTNARLTENNRIITENNRKISEQSEQLKILLRELHHRVKNNLAIVSSLLRLQSRRLKDEGAVEAVRTGQQRVEAMALIHQQLYQVDSVTAVNIREYITELYEGLVQAYGYDKKPFDGRLHIEPAVLDVDLSILLGLILNEILTNAFKHAYEGVDDPHLSIRLLADGSGSPNLVRPGLTLEVQDNGNGLDLSHWERPTGSFGKRLIVSLSEQVGGKLEVQNRNGTYFRLVIPPVFETEPVAA